MGPITWRQSTPDHDLLSFSDLHIQCLNQLDFSASGPAQGLYTPGPYEEIVIRNLESLNLLNYKEGRVFRESSHCLLTFPLGVVLLLKMRISEGLLFTVLFNVPPVSGGDPLGADCRPRV